MKTIFSTTKADMAVFLGTSETQAPISLQHVAIKCNLQESRVYGKPYDYINTQFLGGVILFGGYIQSPSDWYTFLGYQQYILLKPRSIGSDLAYHLYGCRPANFALSATEARLRMVSYAFFFDACSPEPAGESLGTGSGG